MTEDDAKTKWCPHKKGQFPSETECMASGCMMWQWSLTPKDANGASSMEREVEPKGYCGLAGKD